MLTRLPRFSPITPRNSGTEQPSWKSATLLGVDDTSGFRGRGQLHPETNPLYSPPKNYNMPPSTAIASTSKAAATFRRLLLDFFVESQLPLNVVSNPKTVDLFRFVLDHHNGQRQRPDSTCFWTDVEFRFDRLLM
jgi:hypothetical protein